MAGNKVTETYISQLVECAFGFIAISSYECKNKKALDCLKAAATTFSIPIHQFEDKPVTFEPFQNRVNLSLNTDADAGTKIMSCFGVVLADVKVELEPKMIKTSQNIVIDGRTKSSLWIFIPESCNGNCVIKEGCIKTKRGHEFLCYIEAKENIKKGDILTVDFGAYQQHEISIANNHDCQCGYGNCVSRSLQVYPCSFPSCVRNRIPCPTNQGLLSHLKKVHGEGSLPKQKQILSLKREKTKQSLSCTFKSNDKICGKKFSEKKYLNRHVKMIHERKWAVVCKQCGHEFLNQNNYFVHFVKNKNGCKMNNRHT